MELKKGMFVRLQQCYIGKIININEFREKPYCVDIQASDYVFITEKEIVKSSPNIINLIKVGDYVNGRFVSIVNSSPKDKYKKPHLLCLGTDDAIYEKDIVSICTKEVFENGCFKL